MPNRTVEDNLTAEFEPPSGGHLVESIVRAIEEQISSRHLQAGARLPTERELAVEHSVSRTTVRQALHELELKGLVDRIRRRGTTVSDLTQRNISSEALLSRLSPSGRKYAEILDFRAAIEPGIAARAAQYATSSEIRALDELAQSPGLSGDTALDDDAHRRFHCLIAQATHNPLFLELTETTYSWIRAPRETEKRLSRRETGEIKHDHVDLVAAIRARDPVRAEAVALEHITAVVDALGLTMPLSDSHRPRTNPRPPTRARTTSK